MERLTRQQRRRIQLARAVIPLIGIAAVGIAAFLREPAPPITVRVETPSSTSRELDKRQRAILMLTGPFPTSNPSPTPRAEDPNRNSLLEVPTPTINK